MKQNSSSSRTTSQKSRIQEPPLPPIAEELRPWVVAKFSAGYCDVSGPAWQAGLPCMTCRPLLSPHTCLTLVPSSGTCV